ncbi:hypothetical protein HYU89_04860 [Candidatus Collierbacteria bacterium]|nr:hypothetical protein [Candidatus Collierbacteria bacterium]
MDAFTSISFLAAFVAGIVALFAPCCITYLLPAYFGNIFRERRRVLLMTLVYSLGIFSVMLPVVLGAKALSLLFFRLHDQTYYIGGVFLLILAVLSLLGIKLPMINLHRKNTGKVDIWSSYTLGVFSGITSSCCAPVLIGVMTLSTLSPTALMSLGVGIFYVLGMVAPLYLASAFIDRHNILDRPIIRKSIGTINLFGNRYDVLVSNIVAAAVFLVTGLTTISLTRLGLLGMDSGQSQSTKLIQNVAFQVSDIAKGIPGLNFIFLIIIILLIIKLFKIGKK